MLRNEKDIKFQLVIPELFFFFFFLEDTGISGSAHIKEASEQQHILHVSIVITNGNVDDARMQQVVDHPDDFEKLVDKLIELPLRRSHREGRNVLSNDYMFILISLTIKLEKCMTLFFFNEPLWVIKMQKELNSI